MTTTANISQILLDTITHISADLSGRRPFAALLL